MTRANALRGWRTPEENPVDYVPLLIAFRQKKTGIEFVSHQISGYGQAFNDDDYEVLAWQYCPVWDEEGKE